MSSEETDNADCSDEEEEEEDAEDEEEEEEGDDEEERRGSSANGAAAAALRAGYRAAKAVARAASQEWDSDWEPPWEDDFDEEAEEEYMEDVWEESDDDWLPPEERVAKRRRAVAKPKATRRRRRELPQEDEGEDRDEFDLDAEEEVDVERGDAYCPLDLSSFGGEAVQAPPRGVPGELVDPALLPQTFDPFEGMWGDLSGCPAQGDKGFNVFAVGKIKNSGLGRPPADRGDDTSTTDRPACPPLQAHQEVVAFLLHHSSPIRRLLVDHPTGSGKTREMVHILDGFFQDPRPKVPIFPKRPVVNNFYVELLRWPNRYRDYYCCICPGGACLASGSTEWRRRRRDFWDLAALTQFQVGELARSCREVLEMKGVFSDGQLNPGARHAFEAHHPGELFPAAPLRALGYASAGGANTRLDDFGRPQSAFFKIGHPRPWANVYDTKVVFMDEAHNLIRTQTQYSRQLSNLRELLLTAKDTVLAGFTGTPVLEQASEARSLLDVIKGAAHSGASDEGFLSCLAEKPRPLFPACFPGGVPDAALTQALLRQLCLKTPLCGDALQNYVLRTQVPGITERRLSVYCNTYAPAQCYHDGPRGCKGNLLENLQGCAPKLKAVAEEVVETRQKSLILISRACGYRAMLDLTRQAAAAARPPFAVASLEQLNEFNSPENISGDQLLCLVADAAQCSEGVSFRGVRVLHLVDVPGSPSLFAQQCGRASRMFGHDGLPPDEQTVTVRLHLAVFPEWAREPLGAWCLRLFSRKYALGAETEKNGKRLLGRLRKAGVKELADLKRRADAFGVALARKRKAKHSAAEVERRAGKVRATHLGPSHVAELLRSIGLNDEAAPLERLAADVVRARMGSLSKAQRQHWHRPPLLKAVQDLYCASESDILLGLGGSTVDERMLQVLADHSRSVAAALAAVRAGAVDRGLYQKSTIGSTAEEVREPRPAVLRRPSAREAPGTKGGANGPSAGSNGGAAAAAPAARGEGLPNGGAGRPRAGGVAAAASAGDSAVPAAWEASAATSASGRRLATADEAVAAATATASSVVGAAKRRRMRSKGPPPAALPVARSHGGVAALGGSLSLQARDAGAQWRPSTRAAAAAAVAAPREPQKGAAAAGSSSGRVGLEEEERRFRELRGWSVVALKKEIARLSPTTSLAGVVEKEDLCRLAAQLSCPTPATSQLQHTGATLRSTLEAATAMQPTRAPVKVGPSDDLSGWSVGALKDILARVRPDLVLGSIVEREELCRLLRPWL